MSAEDIGTLRDYFQVDNDVRRNMLDALDGLREAGCQVDEVKLGWTEEAYDAWYTVNGMRGSAARKVPDVAHWRPHLADYTLDVLDTGIKATMVHDLSVQYAEPTAGDERPVRFRLDRSADRYPDRRTLL